MTTVIGIFEATDIDNALKKLSERGFGKNDILVVDKDRVSQGVDALPAPTGSPMAVPVVAAPNLSGPTATSGAVVAPAFGFAADMGVTTGLSNLKIADEARDFYASAIKNGGTVVAVSTTAERASLAETTMRQAHASNVSSPAEAHH